MKFLLTTKLLLLSLTIASAQVDPVNKDGVAIGGYDVVSYFLPGGPQKGNSSLKQVYNLVTYYFTSADNLNLFRENPEKYIPQFDGYCALAVSYGKKISIDPLTFKITDNKLYLFFKGKTTHGAVNSIETWNKNETKLLKKAEALWPDVKKSKYKQEDTL
jgi:YHS domain-containing protein